MILELGIYIAYVKIILLENGISKIILNRPEKMNSIGRQILTVYRYFVLAKFIYLFFRVVIIESNCEKAFSSGADLKVF